MSSKTTKLKDGLKQLAQQVGIPVESVLKDFNTFIDVIKSPQQTSDLCEEMIAYLETIERSLRDTDGEFKEELDELNNYLKDMKATIQEHKCRSTRTSTLMREMTTQDLIEQLSQRLSNSLVIFNTRVTLRHHRLTRPELIQSMSENIQALRNDMDKLTARLDASETEADEHDIILMKDFDTLESTKMLTEKNGVVRVHRATWRNRSVEIKQFAGTDREANKVTWKRQVNFCKQFHHARTLRMWGVSPPSEPNPYIVYSSSGIDYREYFRVRRPVAEVFNFLQSVNDAFTDFYQMGCYNWESIMISADQGPVIKLQHENSRNRGEAVDSIATLLVESQDQGITGKLLDEEHEDLSKILSNLLKSNMLINTDEIGSEVDTSMLNTIRGNNSDFFVAHLAHAHAHHYHRAAHAGHRYVYAVTEENQIEDYLEGFSALRQAPFSGPSNVTMLNSSMLLHNLSIPDDRLWKRTLYLIMDASADQDAVEQALIHWESCPTEHSLLHIMAGYIVPPARLKQLETLPDVGCQPGDIGVIDTTRGEWRSLGCPFSASSKKSPNAQITAKFNYKPIDVSPDLRQDWQSVSIPVNPRSKICEIKVVWNNHRSTDEEWAMWRHLKLSSVDVSTCYNVGLTDLEIVTNLILRVRIKPQTGEYMSGGNLHFHRRTSLCASAKDYWGFFSREKDPIVATQMEAESAQYKLKIETLSMADDLEQEANRMIEAELSQIPGSYPSSSFQS